MKINIYYFSGTGNTAWVVKCLSDKLKNLGNEVSYLSCEEVKSSTIDLDRIDMVGIVFPIHSSFPPRIFQEFLLSLPSAKKIPLFAIATAGYTAGDVAWYSVQELKSKGYEPFLFSNIIMGNNLHLPRISPLPVTTATKMKERLKKAELKITKLSELINSKKIHREGVSILGRLLGITQRAIAEKFAHWAFSGFCTDSSCTRCGFCIKNCPINSIKIKDDNIIFLEKCMLCMRCYSFCPTKSIQYTEKTTNLRKYGRYNGPEEVQPSFLNK